MSEMSNRIIAKMRAKSAAQRAIVEDAVVMEVAFSNYIFLLELKEEEEKELAIRRGAFYEYFNDERPLRESIRNPGWNKNSRSEMDSHRRRCRAQSWRVKQPRYKNVRRGYARIL